MYEHPVFCLASQVMDLTIREYLPHSKPPPPSLNAPATKSLTSCRPVFLVLACKLFWWLCQYFSGVSVHLQACFRPAQGTCSRLRLECIFTLLMCDSTSMVTLTLKREADRLHLLASAAEDKDEDELRLCFCEQKCSCLGMQPPNEHVAFFCLCLCPFHVFFNTKTRYSLRT